MTAMERMNQMMSSPASAACADAGSFCAAFAQPHTNAAMTMDATLFVASIFVIIRISALAINLGLFSLSILGLVISLYLIGLAISIIIKNKFICRSRGI